MYLKESFQTVNLQVEPGKVQYSNPNFFDQLFVSYKRVLNSKSRQGPVLNVYLLGGGLNLVGPKICYLLSLREVQTNSENSDRESPPFHLHG